MSSERQPPPRNVPGRWLYVVPVVLLVAAGWTAHAQRASSTVRPGSAEEAAGLEPATDQFDPKRFRIVGPDLIEDTATGVRRAVNLTPGEDIPERFTENLSTNVAIVDDRRYGIGPRPIRVRMESIGLDAEAIPIGLDSNRAIAVPRRADITGWWSGGYVPGETGPTVLVGHFDSKVAPGVFSRLPSAKVGQFVIVDQSDGSKFLYRVIEVERLKKSVFPTEKVYGSTGTSTLRLVTCGGRFDRSTGHYVDNLIVYAEVVMIPPGRGLIDGYVQPDYFPTTTTTTSSTSTLVSDTTTAPSAPETSIAPEVRVATSAVVSGSVVPGTSPLTSGAVTTVPVTTVPVTTVPVTTVPVTTVANPPTSGGPSSVDAPTSTAPTSTVAVPAAANEPL